MGNGNKVRASRRKYHYIYKTTCLITNKYYIGMHSTDDLDDGYMGSGKRIWHSLKKYGRENHQKEILEFLPTRKDLKQREAELVNEELINHVMCMNLQTGGGGGLINEEHGLRLAAAGTAKLKELFADKESEWSKNFIQGRKEWMTLHNQTKWGLGNKSFTGKQHSAETKAKMSESMQGKQSGASNSQYGKCWITNGTESKKIYKGDTIPDGWKLGRVINK